MSDPGQQYSQPGGDGGQPAGAAPTRAPGITVADLIAGVGALVTVIFSFLDFFEAGNTGFNAWDTDVAAFASTIPAILGLALIVVIALGFANVKLPDDVITFNWNQIKATWGITAAGVMIAFLFTSPIGADKGIGFWLMLIGSLAMAVGTIMKLLGAGTNLVNVPTTGAAPGGTAQQGGHPPQPGQQPGSTPPPPPSSGAPPPPPPGV